jgi:hypothetical protein
MKSNYLAPLACSALFFGCSLAYAQTSTSPDPSAMSPSSTQQDTTKGNDVVGNPQPAREDPMASPPSAGQDKATGNDLVSPNKGDMQRGSGNRPDFKTLDSNNHGYLTADDVKSHKWLSKNFSRCNLSHDGHLTQEEYSNCNK